MKAELAQKYWELANAIVGFSLIQVIAFLSSLASKEFRAHVLDKFKLVVGAFSACALSYSVAVIGCYYVEIALRGEALLDKVHDILFLTLLARLAVLCGSLAFGLGILFWGRTLPENAPGEIKKTGD